MCVELPQVRLAPCILKSFKASTLSLSLFRQMTLTLCFKPVNRHHTSSYGRDNSRMNVSQAVNFSWSGNLFICTSGRQRPYQFDKVTIVWDCCTSIWKGIMWTFFLLRRPKCCKYAQSRRAGECHGKWIYGLFLLGGLNAILRPNASDRPELVCFSSFCWQSLRLSTFFWLASRGCCGKAAM